MEEEVITLSSDEEVEARPAVQVIRLNDSNIVLPKIRSRNGTSDKKPAEGDDDDVILLSDDDLPPPAEEVNGAGEGNVVNGVEAFLASGSGSEGQDDEVGSDDFATLAAQNIAELLEKLGPEGEVGNLMTRAQHERMTKKFWKKYYILKSQPVEIHDKLAGIIGRACDKVTPEAGDRVWTILNELLQNFDAKKLRKGTTVETPFDPDAERAKQEEKKQKKIAQLEKKMNRISEKIHELDTMEVDEDERNDHNSAYLQAERLKKLYMNNYYLLCSITKCSKLTGRPVHKRLDITKMTRYPELEKPLQDFINSRGCEFVPDYGDVRTLVSQENDKLNLNFDGDTMDTAAKHLLTIVMGKVKERRAKDFRLVFPVFDDKPKLEEDPADTDPDLLKALEENRKTLQTEAEVVNRFAALQEENKAEPEYLDGLDLNGSPPNSDDEEDDDEPSDVDSLVSANPTDDEANGVGTVDVKDEPLFEEEEDEESGACFQPPLEDQSPGDEEEEEISLQDGPIPQDSDQETEIMGNGHDEPVLKTEPLHHDLPQGVEENGAKENVEEPPNKKLKPEPVLETPSDSPSQINN